MNIAKTIANSTSVYSKTNVLLLLKIKSKKSLPMIVCSKGVQSPKKLSYYFTLMQDNILLSSKFNFGIDV